MATVNLSIATRDDAGKGVSRKLRAASRVPGILYGEAIDEAKPVSVDAGELRRALSTSAGSRVVLNLQFEGKGEKTVAILREVQRHPVSHAMLHADFLAIDLKKPLDVSVPIRAEGTPIGVKNEGGILEWSRRELAIRVLPTHIPEAVDIDVSEMQVGHSLHVGDLKAQDFEIVDDPEQAICAVASARLTIEEEEEAAAALEAEAAEGEAVEGEAGAEGESKEGDSPSSE